MVENSSKSPDYSVPTGGIYLYNSSPLMRNNIIWGNGFSIYNPNDSFEAYLNEPIYAINNMSLAGTSIPSLTFTDFQGGWSGTGNINSDPQFVDATHEMYHLQDFVSPCIDAGDPADDYSLEPYFNGNRINMGAEGGTPDAAKSLVQSGGGDPSGDGEIIPLKGL
jgi:hypothetical protein